MSVERDTQHGDSQQEGDVLTLLVLVFEGLVDGPDDDAYKQYDIDNLARVERTAEVVDKQQLEPAADLYDAGNDTIEHGSQDDYRDKQGDE